MHLRINSCFDSNNVSEKIIEDTMIRVHLLLWSTLTVVGFHQEKISKAVQFRNLLVFYYNNIVGRICVLNYQNWKINEWKTKKKKKKWRTPQHKPVP